MSYRKSLVGAAVGAVLLGTAGVALAADGIGNASVVVVAPLSITPSGFQEMNFGEVSGDSAVATTVILTTGGAVSSPDGALITNPAAASAGSFTVAGNAGAAYDITLPADGVVVLANGVGTDMPVDSFTSNPATSGTLDGAGLDTLLVGATLTINASQTAGTYTGTYTVTVNYQ